MNIKNFESDVLTVIEVNFGDKFVDFLEGLAILVTQSYTPPKKTWLENFGYETSTISEIENDRDYLW